MCVCVCVRWVTCARTPHPALLPLAADTADPLQLPKASPSSCTETPALSPTQELYFCDSTFYRVCHVLKRKKIPCYPHALLCFSQFLFFSLTKPLHGVAHPFWTPFLPQPVQCLSAPFATLREPPSCQKVSPRPSAPSTSPLTQAPWVLGRQAPGVPPSSGLRGASFCPCGATGLRPPAISFPAPLLKQLCLQGSLGDVWRHFVTPGGNAVGIGWGKGRKAAISIPQGTRQPSTTEHQASAVSVR